MRQTISQTQISQNLDIPDVLSERALHLRGVLERVEADLEDVVDEGEERREGVGRHEQRHEAVLDDWGKKLGSISDKTREVVPAYPCNFSFWVWVRNLTENCTVLEHVWVKIQDRSRSIVLDEKFL